MEGILLTQSKGFIIGPIAWVLGEIMNAIFVVLSAIGIHNIGICIILYTVVVYMLMVPLTIKQQKFQRMSQVYMPEIQKIQKKYKNKKDQASMMKMQEESQAVYQKYGVSPMGGCGTALIQFPLFFALYAVIRNIPGYVTQIKEAYMPMAKAILETSGAEKFMTNIASERHVLVNIEKLGFNENSIIDILYKFQEGNWDALADKFPNLSDLAEKTQAGISSLNSFLGISISETPMNIIMTGIKTGAIFAVIVAVLIPILAGITQYMSLKMVPQAANNDDNPMAASMKTMNVMMPLLSVFMCFSFPSGMGLYWIASAVVRTIQQIVINKHLNKVPIEKLVEKNQKKAAKKREKKGVSANALNEMAQRNVKSIQEPKVSMSNAEREEKLRNAAEKTANAKKGSLASKANMVRNFNESK